MPFHKSRSHSAQLGVLTFAICLGVGFCLEPALLAQPSYEPHTYTGVAVDDAGNVYVPDSRHHTIRKVTPEGVLTTLAGLTDVPGSVDGPGSEARFRGPQGVAVDGSGNVYVADTGNYTIRKITPAGVVTTLAGLPGTSGRVDSSGSEARFGSPSTLPSCGNFSDVGPTSVAVDSKGNVYVADPGNYTIRKITRDAMVTTLAGQAGNCTASDGIGGTARFNFPASIALDRADFIYVADPLMLRIRRITTAGVVTTLPGLFASYPIGVAVDSKGNIYVAVEH